MVKSANLGYCRLRLNHTRSSAVQIDLEKRPNPTQPVLTFSLVGDVDQSDFVPWMERQAYKLDVGFAVVQPSKNELTLQAVGAPEMTRAFALACSLGPKSVRIDHLRILEGDEDL